MQHGMLRAVEAPCRANDARLFFVIFVLLKELIFGTFDKPR